MSPDENIRIRLEIGRELLDVDLSPVLFRPGTDRTRGHPGPVGAPLTRPVTRVRRYLFPMNTVTTPAMISAAKAIAEAVKSLPGVIAARVDDWGTFGNFALFIDIAQRDDLDLRAIRRGIKVAVKLHAPKGELRKCIMPRRVYAPRAWGRRVFAAWDSDGRRYDGYGQISVDLDFFHFDSSSNCFPVIQPEGPFELGRWGTPAYGPNGPQPAIS